MKELVIFSSPLLCILIALTVVLHIVGVIFRKFSKDSDDVSSFFAKVFAKVLASSVFPTPVGPKNKNEPMGRLPS